MSGHDDLVGDRDPGDVQDLRQHDHADDEVQEHHHRVRDLVPRDLDEVQQPADRRSLGRCGCCGHGVAPPDQLPLRKASVVLPPSSHSWSLPSSRIATLSTDSSAARYAPSTRRHRLLAGHLGRHDRADLDHVTGDGVGRAERVAAGVAGEVAALEREQRRDRRRHREHGAVGRDVVGEQPARAVELERARGCRRGRRCRRGGRRGTARAGGDGRDDRGDEHERQGAARAAAGGQAHGWGLLRMPGRDRTRAALILPAEGAARITLVAVSDAASRSVVSFRPNGSVGPKHQPSPKDSDAAPHPVGRRRRGHRGLRGAHAPPRRQPRAGVPRDRDHDAPGQAPVPRRAVGRAPHVDPRPAPRRVAVHRERPRRQGRRPRPRDAPRGSRRPAPGPRRADARGRGVHRPLPRAQRAPDARAARGARGRRARAGPGRPRPPRPGRRPDRPLPRPHPTSAPAVPGAVTRKDLA